MSYLGIGAVLFSLWEGWDLIAATYFSFITATSIGFGDLVPLKAFSDTESYEGQFKVIVTSAYCLAGTLSFRDDPKISLSIFNYNL